MAGTKRTNKTEPAFSLSASWLGDDFCTACVDFLLARKGFTVRLECTGDAPVSEKFQVDEPLDWRSAGRALLSYKEDGLLWGDFRKNLDGVQGYADEILALCWMREFNFPDCREFLLQQSDEDLTALADDVGSFLGDEALELIAEYADITDEPPLAAWSRVGSASKPFSLRELVSIVEGAHKAAQLARSEQRSAALARWEGEIQAAVTRAFPRSMTEGRWAGLASGQKRRRLQWLIEEHVLGEGGMPVDQVLSDMVVAADKWPTFRNWN